MKPPIEFRPNRILGGPKPEISLEQAKEHFAAAVLAHKRLKKARQMQRYRARKKAKSAQSA